MSRNHVSPNSISGIGNFVNISAVIASIALIGVGYFAAVGQFAGIA